MPSLALPAAPARFLRPAEAFTLASGHGPRHIVRDSVLPAEEAAALACHVRDRPPSRQAKLGSAQAVRASGQDRGDLISWLTPGYYAESPPAALAALFGFMRDFVAPDVHRVFPSTVGGQVSVQLAKYAEEGAHYVRHADCNHETRRVATCVYYLNPGWREQDAGQLRIYYTDWTSFTETHVDVTPLLNRLVIFPSDLEHEVLASNATSRFAITFWFSRGSVGNSLPASLPAERDTGGFHEPRRKGARGTDKILPGTIHVSIAAYNDPDVGCTIDDLFTKAKDPEAISLGVCWQGDVAPPVIASRPKQVRWILLPAREARGPCPARHLALSRLVQDEEFLMQIDAHMRFAWHWDAALKSQLAQCSSAKPVLSTYPSGLDAQAQPPRGFPLLCASRFDGDGMLRLVSRRVAAPSSAPRPSCFWAAGFSFSRARAFKNEIEYPNIPDLFFGEEILVAAMLWTNGYDFFLPGGKEEMVFHQWKRSSDWRPRHRTEALEAWRQAWIELGEAKGLVRTIKDFEQHCGVDFAQKLVSERAKRGGLEGESEFVLAIPVLRIDRVSDLVSAFLG